MRKITPLLWLLATVLWPGEGASAASVPAAPPALVYSTYLGNWFVTGLAVDAAGSAYVVGTALSPALAQGGVPPATGVQKTFGGGNADAFVAKVAPGGNAFLWTTYLGGSGDDLGSAVAVDAQGNVWVAGRTFSSDFPFKNGFQSRGTVFVSKISADGSQLLYSTAFGGSAGDVVSSIATDAAGAIYLAGEADSPDFPTVSAFQTARRGFSDAYVAKIGASGSLAYATLLGGDSFDEAFGLAVDAEGRAFVTGYTYSANFPATNGPQAAFGGKNDGFLSVVAPDGASLLASTYFGGEGQDVGHGVAVGPAEAGREAVLLVGSRDPAPGQAARARSVRSPAHAPDGAKLYESRFLFTISPPALVLSRALDGGLEGVGFGVAGGPSGRFAVIGSTGSSTLSTLDPIQAAPLGFQDLFVQEIDTSGTLRFASYFGSSGTDLPIAVAADSVGNIWIAGEAGAPDLSLKSAIPGYTKGGFLAKIATGTGTIPCAAAETTLCLGGSRFRVEAAWRTPAAGGGGAGVAVPSTSDAGAFWFFSSNSIDLAVKVVNGTAFNGKFWVFVAGLSDIEYTVTVTDTITGAAKTYVNPSGTLASRADTAAF